MAKKNNIPQVEAPVVEKPEDKIPATTTKKTIPGDSGAMNQHDKVLYASVIQHRKDELKQNGGSADVYAGLTAIEDATIIDIAVTELVINKNPAALILTANENNYNAVRLLAAEMGVTLPEFKTLPKPTKEQLKLAGIESTDATGKVVLRIEDKNVSAEAKSKVKKEEAIRKEAEKADKDYLKDHTKIKTDAQLKEALEFQLVNTKIVSPLDRLITTAQFYRSYLEARAEKADDPKAELAKIHEFTLADLLQDISTMVPPTFTAAGFGKLLCKRISDTKSVIPAFELLKRCGKNRKTNAFRFSDEEIAALVRVLVVWKASAQIASLSKDLKTMSKDAEKNAKAIEKINAEIVAEQGLIGFVTDPNFDLADNFIGAYNNNEDPMHKQAIDVAKSIVETYYKDVEIPELEDDVLLLNIQQHIGIDLNLFNNVSLRRDEYSADNLVSFENSKKVEELEKSEGESKNS